MGFISRIKEAFSPRVSPPETQQKSVFVSKDQYADISRLKEEVDWLAYMVGSDADFTYGEDGTVTQGRKSQIGGPGVMFSYAWAYNQGFVRPGYFACFCINEAQYRIMRARSRAFCSVNPYWHGVQRNMKTHVVGKGHSWILVPRDGETVSDEELRKGQKELDGIYSGYGDIRQSYRKIQLEKIERKSRDGEYFLQYIEEDRKIRFRFVEPLLVWTPPGKSQREDVWFGVQFRKGDYENPLGYYVRRTDLLGGGMPGRGDDNIAWERMIDAAEIQHGKANVDRASPRGIPDTYWVQQRLEQAMRTLKATGTLVQVRAKIGMIQRRVNLLQGSLQPILSEQGVSQTGGGTPELQSVMNMPDGAVFQSSMDSEFSLPSQNLEIKEITSAIQAELQATATSCGLADYMVSGTLGSGASYAASMVSEGPVVKTFEESRAEMIEEDQEAARHGMDAAARYGRISETLMDRCDIEMNGPLLARLGIQEEQANQIRNACGVLDRVTWMQQEGLNPMRVMANEKKYPNPETAGLAMGTRPAEGEGNPSGQSQTKQPRNKQGSSARPFSPDQEPRQIQRASGATREEVYDWLSHDGWSFRFTEDKQPIWTQTDHERSDFGRSYTRNLTSEERGRIQESSHDFRTSDRPTKEDIAMAAKILTDSWKAETKKELLALTTFPNSPQEDGIKEELEPGIAGIYLGMVDRQKVYGVDSDAVMLKYDCPNFVVAGNSEKWKGIVPDDFIYIDWAFNPNDVAHDGLHECGEFRLMQAGWSYNRAHRFANWGPDMEMDFLKVLRPELASIVGTGVTAQTEKDQET